METQNTNPFFQSSGPTQNPSMTPQMPSYADILKDIGESAKEVVTREGRLLKLELSEMMSSSLAEARNTAIFGTLAALAVFPFLAFLVISLGHLLDGRFGLSALLVAVVWGGVCGFLAYRYFKRLTDQNKKVLPRTREMIDESTELVKEKIQEVAGAVRQGPTVH